MGRGGCYSEALLLLCNAKIIFPPRALHQQLAVTGADSLQRAAHEEEVQCAASSQISPSDSAQTLNCVIHGAVDVMH